jgi:YD repeat-containing protein
MRRTTRYVYDPSAAIAEVDESDGTSVKYVYNAVGQKISQTNQAGRTTRYEDDALASISTVQVPANTDRGVTGCTFKRM